MWNPFTKQTQGEIVTLNISGMHCPSCGMNIDGKLEDTKGIISSQTSYAQGKTLVEYDPNQIEKKEIVNKITQLGYSAQ